MKRDTRIEVMLNEASVIVNGSLPVYTNECKHVHADYIAQEGDLLYEFEYGLSDVSLRTNVIAGGLTTT